MPEQKQILNTEFENWKGNTQQIDDVLIMAVKLNFHTLQDSANN